MSCARVCADIFADHASDQCPIGAGAERSIIAQFVGLTRQENFVRFIGMMVEYTNGMQTGPCPICAIQEDQHDYAILPMNCHGRVGRGDN